MRPAVTNVISCDNNVAWHFETLKPTQTEPAPHRIAYMNLAVAAGQFAAAASLTPIMLFSSLQLGQSQPALHIGISLPLGSANPISNCDAASELTMTVVRATISPSTAIH
jgi:hypothetical protein